MAFPSLPVAALGGRGGTWAAGGGSFQALEVRGRLHSPTTNQCTFCCHRGLENGVGQLQEFWQWPGTELFSGMSLRLCKGMSPGHFFSYKISPTFPICPTVGHREGYLATLQLQLTLQKYQQQILQLRIPQEGEQASLLFPFLQGSLQEARCSHGPVAPRDCVPLGAHTQSRHSAFLFGYTHPVLSRPLNTLAAAG